RLLLLPLVVLSDELLPPVLVLVNVALVQHIGLLLLIDLALLSNVVLRHDVSVGVVVHARELLREPQDLPISCKLSLLCPRKLDTALQLLCILGDLFSQERKLLGVSLFEVLLSRHEAYV